MKALIIDGFGRQAMFRKFRPGASGIALLLVLAAALFLPKPTHAQGGPGFLFAQPRASVGAKFGYSFPAVGSDLFDFTRQQFTLDDSDFRSPYIGGEVAVRVAERVDVVFDFGWARSKRSSEYRDFEDLDDLPIEQETTFERISMVFGAKYYLTSRGRAVGQFAWIPSRITPFVGVGAGVMWHEFAQLGEFIDFDTLDVFADRLLTSGVSPIVDARLGADFSISRRVVLVGEALYNFGSGSTGGDYVSFADTDLSGFKLVLGVSFRL